jgi:hypothetical protein
VAPGTSGACGRQHGRDLAKGTTMTTTTTMKPKLYDVHWQVSQTASQSYGFEAVLTTRSPYAVGPNTTSPVFQVRGLIDTSYPQQSYCYVSLLVVGRWSQITPEKEEWCQNKSLEMAYRAYRIVNALS